ncbi:MAG: hypothetical protein AAB250_12915, partial [Bdellovibrionota bacterium]
PSEVNGSNVVTANGRTFLRAALEINDDEIGNNNGLCETNEACLYAPNQGSYQGEGDYKANGICTFSPGTISGVIMYGYPTTGAP